MMRPSTRPNCTTVRPRLPYRTSSIGGDSRSSQGSASEIGSESRRMTLRQVLNFDF